MSAKDSIAAQEAFRDAVKMGHAATGKKVSVRGLQISTFKGGKLVERWGSSDQLGILTQLGLA